LTLSINLQETWAILIGTGEFTQDTTLPATPAVEHNLVELRKILTHKEIIGIPDQQIIVIKNQANLYDQLTTELEKKLPDLVETLLVYYSGHGFRHKEDVYLAATNSKNRDPEVGSLAFGQLWNKTNDRATHNLLYVLDCCFSGEASKVIAQRKQKNIALLTASSPEDTAKTNKSLTVFTRYFIELLEQGYGPEPTLTPRILYEELRKQLVNQGYPKPAYNHLMSDIHFAKNRAYNPDNLNQYWHVPWTRNQNFTGRVAFLTQLEAALSQFPIVAVTNMGGVGKTQTAIEYAYRHKQRYRAVLWVGAENEVALESGLAALAPVLKLPAQSDLQLNITAVKTWLAHENTWLLILDNADGQMADIIAPLCRELTSHGTGVILVTSQRRTLDTRIHTMSLNAFTVEEGTAFLLRATVKQWNELETQEQTALRQLGDAVGWLPLLLDVMAASIHERQSSFHRFYTKSFQPFLAKWLDKPSADHPKSTLATFGIAFEQIQADCPQAMEILRLCAFLAGEAMPEAVFADMDEETFEDALAVILRYSLVQRDFNTGTLTMHRSVQTVLRFTMDTATQRVYAERAVNAVNRAFPRVDDELNWLRCVPLMPCGLQCVEWIEQWGLESEEAARLLTEISNVLYYQGRYAQAKPLTERSLAIRKQLLGEEHAQVAESLNDLAVLYYSQGDYAQALPLYQRALEIRERVLGPDHPDTATSLNNLAELYDSMGDYAQALPLLRRALEIRERVLGPDHPDTAQSLHNLAVLYRTTGDYAQALPLSQRALEIRERVLGPDHPDTAASLNNLAYFYKETGDYAQALPLYERALEIRERVLGPDHPATAASLNNLAELYRATGDTAQALPLSQRALEIRERVLGPDHPDTATSLVILANSYQVVGDYAQALPLSQRALEIGERVLGPDHPDTATSLVSLANSYQVAGDYVRALPLHQRALEIRERVLGTDHPDTATSFASLANFYQMTGDYAQALPLYERALTILKKTLGLDHPILRTIQDNLRKNIAGLENRLKVRVKEMTPDGIAMKMGIQLSDVFALYDGQVVLNSLNFVAGRNQEPKDSVPKILRVLREGKELTFMLSPGKIGAILEDWIVE